MLLASLNWADIVFRWMHIFSAITIVGGAIFMRFALLPASGTIDASAREAFQQSIRRRWMPLLSTAMLLLLVSGFYTIGMNSMRYDLPPYYNPLFGIKFLLALAIFFFASALAGRSKGTERFRENASRWLTINLVLAVILVCISGVLRNAPKPPKASDVESSPAEAGSDADTAGLPAAIR